MAAGVAAALLTAFVADASASSGVLYVTDDENAGAVVPVALSTLTAGTAITSGIGSFPFSIAISPDAGTAFSTAEGGPPSISAIDTGTNTASQVTDTNLTSPGAIAVSPDGSQLYVGNVIGDTVAVANAHTLAVAATPISVGTWPVAVAFTPGGGRAYVANASDGTVSVVDTSSETVTQTISLSLPLDPCGLAVTPDGADVVVIGGCNALTGGVSIIDTATGIATAIGPPLGTDAYGAEAMAPSGKLVYVYDTTSGALRKVNPKTGATPTTPFLSGLGGVKGLAVSPGGESLFATRLSSSSVSKINATSGAITPISPVANKPWGAAITPDQAPHAALTVTAAPAGSASKFSAAATSTADGGPASYAWAFGDGKTAKTTTPSVTHVYAQPGTYAAAVTVTDDQGCSTKLVYTGQTASCNGASTARRATSFKVPAPSPVLSVSVSGRGQGQRTRDQLPGPVLPRYAVGTRVKLTAKAKSGFRFAGWSGACAGAGRCSLAMNAARSVAARFVARPPNTKITRDRISTKKGKAKFNFTAKGRADGFKCELRRKHHAAKKFKGCHSPKTYRHLKHGSYTFEVRAIGPGGPDPTPAKQRFAVKR